MLRFVSLALSVALGSITLGAAGKEEGRLENCGVVMEAMSRSGSRDGRLP